MRFTCLLLCLILSAHAQKETNIWYFGIRGGVDFNTSPPTALSDGRTVTFGTVGSVCDTSGSLLFYTDGKNVYDSDQAIMSNGNSLSKLTSYGEYNVLAAPWPERDSLYYIFTLQTETWPDLYAFEYAIVNMRQNGGLGAVSSKNNAVYNKSGSVAGAFHRNGKDIWIITHGYRNKIFKVHALTAAGFNPIPQTQTVGTVATRATPMMKVSPDGKYLALVEYDFIELFDFDNATGRLSHRVQIDEKRLRSISSVEFSPNSRFLYVINHDAPHGKIDLERYDLKATDLAASKEIIVKESAAGMVDLRLANDQNIYVGYERSFHLGRISQPNSSRAVKFEERYLRLSGYARIYLPNFVRGYLPSLSMSDICQRQPIDFKLSSRFTIDKAIWDFGDGTPTVDQVSPQHTYTKPGPYNLTVEYTYADGQTFTLSDSIEIDTLDVRLPAFSNVCVSSLPFSLNQETPKGGTYKGTGVDSKTNMFSPTVAGVGTFPITYVWTSRYGCRDSVTQNIAVQKPQILTLAPGIDTFCLNSPTVNLNRISPAGGTYLGKGVTGSQFSPLAAGLGTHTITYVLNDACGSLKTFDLVVSAAGQQLQFSKTISKDVCGNTKIIFTNTSSAETSGFTWTAGDGAPPVKSRDFVHTYTRAGTYTVMLEAECGKTASEVVMIPAGNKFKFQNDTTICAGDSIRLAVGGADTYTWNPSSSLNNPHIANPLAFLTTTTEYIVKMEKASCILYDTVKVTVLPSLSLDFKTDLVNGCDSFQKVILKNNAPTDLTFSWQDEAGNTLTRLNEATIESQKPRPLWVYLKTNLGSCSKRDSVFFDIKPNPDYLSLSTISLKASSSTSCGKTDPVQLEASGGSTYLWQPTAGLSNSTIPNPIATPSSSTTYTVTITNAAGCAVRRSLKVEILNAPKIEFTIEKMRQVCNQVPEVHFKNTTGAAEYLWDFGDGSTSKDPSPIHRYAKGGTYKIKLRATSANACFADTTFEVQVEEALVYNAFSPNGDGINETLDFGLEGWGVEVYNRWGNLVYESSDYKNDWNGGSLTAGTYYYVLRSPLGYRCRGWVALLK